MGRFEEIRTKVLKEFLSLEDGEIKILGAKGISTIKHIRNLKMDKIDQWSYSGDISEGTWIVLRSYIMWEHVVRPTIADIEAMTPDEFMAIDDHQIEIDYLEDQHLAHEKSRPPPVPYSAPYPHPSHSLSPSLNYSCSGQDNYSYENRMSQPHHDPTWSHRDNHRRSYNDQALTSKTHPRSHSRHSSPSETRSPSQIPPDSETSVHKKSETRSPSEKSSETSDDTPELVAFPSRILMSRARSSPDPRSKRNVNRKWVPGVRALEGIDQEDGTEESTSGTPVLPKYCKIPSLPRSPKSPSASSVTLSLPKATESSPPPPSEVPSPSEAPSPSEVPSPFEVTETPSLPEVPRTPSLPEVAATPSLPETTSPTETSNETSPTPQTKTTMTTGPPHWSVISTPTSDSSTSSDKPLLQQVKKSRLKTRVEALESCAYSDGKLRDGKLIFRIREMEGFIFDPDYTPPKSLDSRVNLLAQEFGLEF